jgi:hypothetical protein
MNVDRCCIHLKHIKSIETLTVPIDRGVGQHINFRSSESNSWNTMAGSKIANTGFDIYASPVVGG